MSDHVKAEQISMEAFIEAATRAALRAVQASGLQDDLNPQPLPPGEARFLRFPGPIFIGIRFESPAAAAE